MEYNSLRLSLHLSYLGATVVIITTAHPDYPGEDYFLYCDKVLVAYVGNCPSGVYSATWQERTVDIFEKLHSEYQFDIIHSHNSSALGLYNANIFRKYNLKYVVTWHGMHWDWIFTSFAIYMHGGYDRNEIFYISKVLKRYFFEDFALSFNASALIAIDTAALTKLRYAFFRSTRKIHLIPTGLDTRLFNMDGEKMDWSALGFSKNDRVLLSICRLVKDKGVFITIRAYKEIWNRCNNVKLVVVGEGPDLGELQTLAKNLGVSANVVFKGRIPPEECAKYLRAAAIFINPVIHDGGFNTTLLEAMACGCPTITTDLSCNTDILTHSKTGILVKKGCYKSVAWFATRLLEEEHLRQAIIQQAAAGIHERYGWNHIARKTLLLFETVIHQ